MLSCFILLIDFVIFLISFLSLESILDNNEDSYSCHLTIQSNNVTLWRATCQQDGWTTGDQGNKLRSMSYILSPWDFWSIISSHHHIHPLLHTYSVHRMHLRIVSMVHLDGTGTGSRKSTGKLCRDPDCRIQQNKRKVKHKKERREREKKEKEKEKKKQIQNWLVAFPRPFLRVQALASETRGKKEKKEKREGKKSGPPTGADAGSGQDLAWGSRIEKSNQQADAPSYTQVFTW